MRTYASYHDARRAAEEKANETGLDVAIRRVNDYGRVEYTVSFACRNDSDYAKAEIVGPRTRA